MSSTKADVGAREEKSSPAFTTKQPASEKKSAEKERGSNFTPKSEFRSKRDFDHLTWVRQFKALCRKWDRETYHKRSELK